MNYKRDDRRHPHDRRDGEPEVLERNPVAREPAGGGILCRKFQEDHEIGNVRFVLTQFPDVQHEVHPERVSAQRKEEALAKTQQAGVAPKQIYAERQHRETKVFAIDAECESGDVEGTARRHEGVEARQDDEAQHREEGDEEQLFS